MRILLSNDDGVLAPGLAALAHALKKVADVTVVAPESERSGFSSALTLDRPLRPLRLSNGFWSVNGTPADCVYLAVNGFFDQEPDMVISGINSGANLGDDVLYSGTVGAALEGRFLGKPSLAVSLCGASVKQYSEPVHFEAAAQLVCQLVEHWKELELPIHNIINMNVPDLSASEIQGFRLTRLGKRKRGFSVSTVEDPRGRKAYWIGLAGDPNTLEEGTDFHAVNHGFVSLTPLQTDLTSHDALPGLTTWLNRNQGN